MRHEGVPESARGFLFNAQLFAAYCRVSGAWHRGVRMSVELSQAEPVRQWLLGRLTPSGTTS